MKYRNPLAVLVLLFALFGYLLHSAYLEVKQQTIDQVNSQQLLLAKQAAKSIEDFFDHYVRVMTSLAGMDSIIDMDERSKELMKVFYHTHTSDIKSITRLDENGKVIYAYPPLPSILAADLSHQEHVQKIMRTHQPVVSDVFRSVQGFASVALHVPVFEQDIYRGSLGILIPFDYLAKDYLAAIKIAESGYAWMVSRQGVELYCPVPGHIGKTVFENCRDFPSILAMAREMLQGKQGVTWYTFDKIKGQDIEPAKKLAAYLPVRLPGTFWSIVVATPEDEVLATIRGFRNKLLLITGLMLIVVVSLSYYFSRAFLIMREVAKRRQVEENLRQSEEKYRTLVDNSPIGIYRTTPGETGAYLSANPALLKMLGFESFEDLQQTTPAQQYIHPAERRQFSERLLAAGNLRAEHRLKKKDGTPIWGSITARVIKGEDGECVYFDCTMEDTTDRKLAEKALVESEAKYRAIVEDQTELVSRFLPDGTLTFVNQAYCRFFEENAAELVGQKFWHHVPAADQEMFRQYLSGFSPQKSVNTIEHRVVNRRGEIFWQQWNDRAIFNEEGDIIEFQAVGRDITERKVAEQEKQKLEAELRHAQKMEAIGTLAGGIAHEFNNILGIILGNAELAADDIPQWNPAKLNLDQIKTASLRAKDIVQQLLTFSRKREENRRPIDLVLVVEEAVKFLRSSIPTSIEIRSNISNEECIITADPTQIQQIMINLSTNAAHAMEDRGGILQFSLQKSTLSEANGENEPKLDAGRYVVLEVSDTGGGIPAAVVNRIFDPYFTTKEAGKGVGMGLAVVHGIVQSHGGHILVESGREAGTKFKLFFPATDAAMDPAEEQHEDIPRGTERILFVDDDESLAQLGTLQLESLGYHVTAQTNPQKALEMFRSNPDRFDLIITDMTMPGMTGDRLIAEILGIRPNLPAILCTGFSERIDEERALMLGAREYALKPVGRKQLAMIIRKVLDGIQ
ncbi:hybrid sensor histidine kinase/response regulator [Desulfoferrobacter suflitae]|uniref:hybrid sensor histidine kinase/response regulator n=1 Tax=Desulfoferrobacter suflitae TaxID=2865782 RepID=UPI0021642FD3|nr:PAS domain S-box protein [Desulfoferrobacter suflitae]MCK8603602.1 PAS domain S-box protein [Desulfoferrobacter suflitae]